MTVDQLAAELAAELVAVWERDYGLDPDRVRVVLEDAGIDLEEVVAARSVDRLELEDRTHDVELAAVGT